MERKSIEEATKKVRESSKKRNFNQSFDLAISLKDFDLKKEEGKIKEEVVLPHGKGKEVKVGVIAEGELAENAKKNDINIIIGKDQLGKLAKNRAELKKLVNSVDFFIAQPDLMIEVGKTLGPILGPRDKMPKPVPPNVDLKEVLARLSKVINLRVKDQPVIHCAVGTEDMEDSQVADNIEAVLTALERKLPKGKSQIKAVHLKLTMGPSVNIGAEK